MSNPLNFCKAEEFFQELPKWTGPTQVTSVSEVPPADTESKENYHGVTLTFNDGTMAVVQFIRPTVWRVRYDPAVKNANEYSDLNRSVDCLILSNTPIAHADADVFLLIAVLLSWTTCPSLSGLWIPT